MNFAASQDGEEVPALNIALVLGRTCQQVGVRVSERGGMINAEIVSNPESASVGPIRQHLVCVLNLDVGHGPFVNIGERDPVVAHLRERYPRLRPAQFQTPWEGAAWAVIGHRIRINHAAAIKRRFSERFGHRIGFPGGQVLDSFPGPETVLSLPAISAVGAQVRTGRPGGRRSSI